ncbi:MAG: CapA family protein [Chloroflexi bacterium]|nr:CapA family protein [Chloroflexota bacterium]
MSEERETSLTLIGVGDIVLAKKDQQSTFARALPILRKADIAFFNCETPYATVGSPNMYYAMAHDPAKMPALAAAGFNVCTLANNHTGDWGVDAIVECRERLEALGIAVCGAGRNMTEARKPAIVERKGVRIAFLGYLCVGPDGFMAEDNKPGTAVVRIHTLYEQADPQPGTPPSIITFAYKEDLQNMIEDIRKARELADIVVVAPHWGLHHTPVVIPDYDYEVGHAAIDAGADLIIGDHPHILKGIEVYKGKVIMHAMSNFAMEHRIAAKEGELRQMILLKSWANAMHKLYGPPHPAEMAKSLILKCVIADKKIQKVSYVPVMLENWTDPEPLTRKDERAQDIFRYIEDISRAVGFNTRFTWEGEEVVINA